ncbi:MAG: hypothetical protein WC319_15970 [Candidatus Paceibacterota bacterium]|jgi:uncharacterized protein YktA (UPF0223 family)
MKLREDEELLRRDDYKRYKELRALPLSHAKAIERMVLDDYGVSRTWSIDREEFEWAVNAYKRIVKAERAKERKEEREIERLRRL